MHQKPVTSRNVLLSFKHFFLLAMLLCLAGVGATDSACCTVKEGLYGSWVQHATTTNSILLEETLNLHLPTPTRLSCTYSTPCASFTCNVNNWHHQHSLLFHYSTYPCNSNLWAHCIPTKLFYNTRAHFSLCLLPLFSVGVPKWLPPFPAFIC